MYCVGQGQTAVHVDELAWLTVLDIVVCIVVP